MWWRRNRLARTPKAETAFTLIEMVLATALAAMVMVGTLSVLGRFGQWCNARRAGGNRRDAAEAVMRVVEADLLAGRRITIGSDGFAVEGFGWIDPDTLRATQLPARVVYEVRAAGEQSWLVRRQHGPDEAGTIRSSAELLCPDVTKVVLQEPVGPDDEPPERPPAKGKEVAVNMPAALTLTLTWKGDGDRGERSIERTFHIR